MPRLFFPRSPVRVSIIVAVSENNVIGRGGGLPWRLSSDLRRFKKLTMDHAIVMGRKTWESIGRPLPGRRMVVLSSHPDDTDERIAVFASLEEALEALKHEEEVFVVGGARVYRDALPFADRLYRTRVHADIEGDTHFPTLDDGDWKLISEDHYEAGEKDEYASTFEVWHRVT